MKSKLLSLFLSSNTVPSLLRLRNQLIQVVGFGVTGISTAHAALPVIEGPKSSTDASFYGQISGYLNDGVVLGGLILAAVGMLVVGNAIISTFAEVQQGKSTWAKFGMLVVVGIILIVSVIWLATKAAAVIL